MGLKIAIVGTRGVPNNYGGFEHIAGYLARGLVQKDHQVTVYNSSRHPYQQKEWHGVQIIHCFDPENLVGVAGQFVYDLNCILNARKKDYDIILMLGYTSSSIWGFLYPEDSIVINNMDGLEWKRSKYSGTVKTFLKFAEHLAVKSSSYQIADSPVIKQYLDNKYGIKCKYIPYGAELNPAKDEEVLQGFGVKQYQYYLLMARMEPENNIEMILDGFCLSGSGKKFVVIGNTVNHFGDRLRKKYKQNRQILFAGAVFDDRKTQSLTAFCSMYFHGHSVGGTNPSLLDVMGAKVPIAAHQNPFNSFLLKNNARYFNNAVEVARIIQDTCLSSSAFANSNYATALNEFNWELVVDQYEKYFMECYMESHYSNQVMRIEEIKI
ncbi:MAG: DUF1972 domain-containing protein [Chitinophagaceae bacterium]|nr:DUF1972 domain-containing protein [Chitinophagaceae bacterium]